MNTLEIRDTCRGCDHKELRFKPGENELPMDWCNLAKVPCEEIKSCHEAAKVPRVRRDTRKKPWVPA
jgi:hypothetical protein